jgi:hypothetical protein
MDGRDSAMGASRSWKEGNEVSCDLGEGRGLRVRWTGTAVVKGRKCDINVLVALRTLSYESEIVSASGA